MAKCTNGARICCGTYRKTHSQLTGNTGYVIIEMTRKWKEEVNVFKKIALMVLCLVLVAAFGLFCYNRYKSNYERYYDFLGPQLSEEQKETISAACAEAGITPVNWEAEDWKAGAVRYYGNFKGYDVIFLFPESITREPDYYFFGIAVAKIPYGGCEFYAYKDGKVCTVMQLVEEGTFVYDDLADILKQHNHRRYDNYPRAYVYPD